MKNNTSRLASIDLLKAISAQLIVLHHLSFYGPMSDIAYELSPRLIDWLFGQARLAVQVFLVAGGFLAARNLASRASPVVGRPHRLIWRRYRRLAIPLWAALALAVACAACARSIYPQASDPAAPEMLQFLAHLALLQDVLGFDVLSAGVWFVAIDFQLYALQIVTDLGDRTGWAQWVLLDSAASEINSLAEAAAKGETLTCDGVAVTVDATALERYRDSVANKPVIDL